MARMPQEHQAMLQMNYWDSTAKMMHGLAFEHPIVLIPKYSTTELMERYEAVSDWIAPRNEKAIQRELETESWYANQRKKIDDATQQIDRLEARNAKLIELYKAEKTRRESSFFGIGAMLNKQNDKQARWDAEYRSNKAKIHGLQAEKKDLNEAYQDRLQQEVAIEYRHFNKELKTLRQEIAKRPLEEFGKIWAQTKAQMQTAAGVQAANDVLDEFNQEQDQAAKRLALYFGAKQMKETDETAKAQQEWQNRRSRGRGFGGRKIDRGDDFGISD